MSASKLQTMPTEFVVQEALRECAKDYCRSVGKDPESERNQYVYTDVTPFQKLGRDLTAKLKLMGYSIEKN